MNNVAVEDFIIIDWPELKLVDANIISSVLLLHLHYKFSLDKKTSCDYKPELIVCKCNSNTDDIVLVSTKFNSGRSMMMKSSTAAFFVFHSTSLIIHQL